MARVAVTLSVIFSLFVLSLARTPFDLKGNDVNERDLSNTLPVSDPKSSILLPSETLESEANTVERLPESDPKSDILLPIEERPEVADDLAAIGLTQPLTVTYDISFRPIDHHFHHVHVKQPFPFRFPHRCRHHRKPFGPGFRREIPYGNDMIMSREKVNLDHTFHGDVRQIPARWVRFPREMRGISFKPVNALTPLTKEEFKMASTNVEEENRIEEEGEEGGFMKQFRRFLNRF